LVPQSSVNEPGAGAFTLKTSEQVWIVPNASMIDTVMTVGPGPTTVPAAGVWLHVTGAEFV